MTSTTLRRVAATIASICGAVTTAELSHVVALPHWLVSTVALAGMIAAVFVPSPAGATQEQVIKASQTSPVVGGGK